jgi:hypothetical protein
LIQVVRTVSEVNYRRHSDKTPDIRKTLLPQESSEPEDNIPPHGETGQVNMPTQRLVPENADDG